MYASLIRIWSVVGAQYCLCKAHCSDFSDRRVGTAAAEPLFFETMTKPGAAALWLWYTNYSIG